MKPETKKTGLADAPVMTLKDGDKLTLKALDVPVGGTSIPITLDVVRASDHAVTLAKQAANSALSVGPFTMTWVGSGYTVLMNSAGVRYVVMGVNMDAEGKAQAALSQARRSPATGSPRIGKQIQVRDRAGRFLGILGPVQYGAGRDLVRAINRDLNALFASLQLAMIAQVQDMDEDGLALP
jgi:hypothetical protein